MVDTGYSESAATRFESYLAPILTSAYGIALHLTRHRDDAEDLVQEAALQSFRAFDSFQEGTNFKAWFCRILTNLFINAYRKRQRTPEIDTSPVSKTPRRCICSSALRRWAFMLKPRIRRRWCSRKSRQNRSIRLSPPCQRIIASLQHSILWRSLPIRRSRQFWGARSEPCGHACIVAEECCKRPSGIWPNSEALSPRCVPPRRRLAPSAIAADSRHTLPWTSRGFSSIKEVLIAELES